MRPVYPRRPARTLNFVRLDTLWPLPDSLRTGYRTALPALMIHPGEMLLNVLLEVLSTPFRSGLDRVDLFLSPPVTRRRILFGGKDADHGKGIRKIEVARRMRASLAMPLLD